MDDLLPFVNVSDFTLSGGRSGYSGRVLTLPIVCQQASKAFANVSIEVSATLHAGQLRAGLRKAVDDLFVACHQRSTPGTHDAGASVPLRLSREVRVVAAAQLEAADPMAKLAFELDATGGSDDDESGFGGSSAQDAGRARVGVFVLRGDPVTPPGRRHTPAGIHLAPSAPMLAHSLAHALWKDTDPHTRYAARLHVLAGPKYAMQDFDPEAWRQWLGAATPLLGGLHLCGEQNRLSPHKSTLHQGNYMHKAWTMVALSRMLGYEYILSTDDDVFMPPHTLRAFVRAARARARSDGLGPSAYASHGCGVLLPALSSGVPTAEFFEGTALPLPAQQRLDACYGGSNLASLGRWGPIPTRGLRPIQPWDAMRWYEQVRYAVRGVYKGIHPVRANNTCMSLSLQLALAHLQQWWLPQQQGEGFHDAIEAFGPADAKTPAGSPFPYFTNTIWMATVDLYATVLRRVDLSVDDTDEVAMNRYIVNERRMPICVLTRSPVLHPAYNSHGNKPAMLEAAALAIEAAAGLQPPKESPHAWQRELERLRKQGLLSRQDSVMDLVKAPEAAVSAGAARSASAMATAVTPSCRLAAHTTASQDGDISSRGKLTETLDTAVVIVACSSHQNQYLWPSYRYLPAGVAHDLIVVHRNWEFVNRSMIARSAARWGHVLFLDKSAAANGGTEVPHRAFGAYRFAFRRFHAQYSRFCFVADHVYFRRAGWLASLETLLASHARIGFVASQVFNGHDAGPLSTRYPHESHVRAPGPILIRAEALRQIDWSFESDHEGEMSLGAKLVAAGWVGAQAGDKLSVGYDTLGNPPLMPFREASRRSNYRHIAQLLEWQYFPEKKGTARFEASEFDFFEARFSRVLNKSFDAMHAEATVTSPFRHIGVMRVFYDLQPFHGLLYGPSLEVARKAMPDRVRFLGGNAYCLAQTDPPARTVY